MGYAETAPIGHHNNKAWPVCQFSPFPWACRREGLASIRRFLERVGVLPPKPNSHMHTPQLLHGIVSFMAVHAP